MDRRLYGRGGGSSGSGNGFNGFGFNGFNGTGIPTQSSSTTASPPQPQITLTPTYITFLEAYFANVRDTSAMFRSISDTLRTAYMHAHQTPTPTPTPNPRSMGGVVPPGHHRASDINSNAGTNANARATNNHADNDIEYISGVTFNIPIHETDTNIFNLLASYANNINNPRAANTMNAASATAPPPRANINTQAVIATNTTSVRYMDIGQDRRTYDACPITRDVFTNDVPVLMMHCGHYFSENGLSRWLETHTTCPICRYDFRSVAAAPEHDNINNNNINNNNINNNINNNNNDIT